MQVARPVTLARRDRQSLAARRRTRSLARDLDSLSALVGNRTKAILICNPNNPTGARLTSAELDGICRIAVANRRMDPLRRDLPRRRARRRRDGDGVGPHGARDRHERAVEGLRPAGTCASGGSPGRPRSSRRCGASTTTRRLRPAPSTIGWRGSRSRRRGARNCSRARGASCAPTIRSCATGWPRARRSCRTSPRRPAPSPSSAITTRSTRRASSSGCETKQSVLVVPGDHFEMDGYLRIGFGSDPTHLTNSLERIGALLDTIPRRRRCSLISRSSVSATSAGASPGCSTNAAIALARDFDLTCRVTGIATRRHGAIYNADGVDARGRGRPDRSRAARSRMLARRAGRRRQPRRHRRLAESSAAAARARGNDDARHRRRRNRALDHVRIALAAGCHVVTANKGPVAFAYRELVGAGGAERRAVPLRRRRDGRRPGVQPRARDDADGADRGLSRRREQHDQPHPDGARGRRGVSRPRSRTCRREGIAEADPSLDVDGWDAAAKAAALANVLLDGGITPHDVDRTGIGPDTASWAREARTRGVPGAARRVSAAREPAGRAAGGTAAGRSPRRPARHGQRAHPRHRHARPRRHLSARRRSDAHGVRAPERSDRDPKGCAVSSWRV